MTDEDQNEDRNKNDNNQSKKPLTPDALKQRVSSQIKQARIKEVEAQIKTKYTELRKAETVVSGIKNEIENIIEENEEIFG